MEINNNTRKSSTSEIQNIPNHALFRRTRVGNAFFGSGAGAAGAAEEAGADSEMEEERREDRRFRIMGGVGPGTVYQSIGTPCQLLQFIKAMTFGN